MRSGSQLTHLEKIVGVPRRRRWEIKVEDFGYADLKIESGDLDGSGDAPGVQLEFEHQGCPGGAAIAFGAHEAELTGRALMQAAEKILPHERLKTRRRKWERSIVQDQPVQTSTGADYVTIESEEVAEALVALIKASGDPRLKPVLDQLEIPF